MYLFIYDVDTSQEHICEITKIRQYTGNLKHPCTLRASLSLSMPNTVGVQVQRASPNIAGHCTIGTSPRLSMPNTVRVQVERVSPSTRARSVHRPGCPCHKLYEYKYNVRTQARGPKHNRRITQTIYAINCACTSTASEPEHAGLSTIGASPRLSIPVHAQVRGCTQNGASPRLSMPKHCASGTTTVRAYKHKHPCILHTPPRLPMPYTVPRTHTRTHDEWYNARAAHADRRTYTHTHTGYTAWVFQAEHRTARIHAEHVAHEFQYKF